MKIRALIAENPTATIQDFADSLGLSKRGAEEKIKKLKSIGFLRRIGPAKGGHWEVVG